MRRAAYLAIVVQTLIASITFVVAKSALVAFRPLELAGLRMIGAAILMTAAAVLCGARRIDRRHLGVVALLGVIGVTVNQTCFLSGLDRSTPTHAALLYALTPAFVYLIALRSGDERLTLRRGAGIALAFIGAALIIGIPRRGEAPTLRGDLLLVVAVFAWAFYSARARRSVQAVGTLTFTALTFAIGALAGLAIVLPSLVRLDAPAIPEQAWAGLAFLIVFTSVIAYALWSFALRRLEASQVAISANAQPVLTACLSHFVLGEPITGAVIVGGALVLTGVALTQTGVAAGRVGT